MREGKSTSDAGYHWTDDSALYQLRCEPSGRRASAVAYLAGVIMSGSPEQVRTIAVALLTTVEEMS